MQFVKLSSRVYPFSPFVWHAVYFKIILWLKAKTIQVFHKLVNIIQGTRLIVFMKHEQIANGKYLSKIVDLCVIICKLKYHHFWENLSIGFILWMR